MQCFIIIGSVTSLSARLSVCNNFQIGREVKPPLLSENLFIKALSLKRGLIGSPCRHLTLYTIIVWKYIQSIAKDDLFALSLLSSYPHCLGLSHLEVETQERYMSDICPGIYMSDTCPRIYVRHMSAKHLTMKVGTCLFHGIDFQTKHLLT